MSDEAKLTQAEWNIAHSSKVPFYRIVLTGGPCGGKTTALARVSTFLRERGFEVMISPEAFTMLKTNGLNFDFFNVDGMAVVVQRVVLDMQQRNEDGFGRILRASGKPAVLLCDRGMMDSFVYLPRDDLMGILASRNEEPADWRERRYNAVFHMVTAADGAADYYTLENNETRRETPEEAVEVDQRTQQAWMGHPHLTVVDNSTNFEGKLQRLVESMARLVGLPTNLSRTPAKFLLQRPPDLKAMLVEYQIFEVEKVYLIGQDVTSQWNGSVASLSRSRSYENLSDDALATAVRDDNDSYSFIRKRTQLDQSGERKIGGTIYGFTAVERQPDGRMIEKKRIISAREYTTALKQRDFQRRIVKQHRISFLYKHQSFNIHIYLEPSPGLCILHAQVETKQTKTGEEGAEVEEEQPVELPPFLRVERRLQNTPEDILKYGAFGISLQR